jgi:hypothetical protein
MARSLYSLPTRFIGRTLDVRVDRASVRFYLGSEMVKTGANAAGKVVRLPEERFARDAS